MLSKKLFALALIIPFLSTMPATQQEKPVLAYAHVEAKPVDKRAEILQAYLAKYDSPMQYQAQSFIDAADKNNLDWKLLPAIAGVESTFGKFIPGGYNAWGWGVYGNQAIYFDSWDDGINTVATGLRQNYLNKGLTDPDSINSIYSTSDTWGTHVNYFLNDISRFERQYAQTNPVENARELEPKIAGQSGVLALKLDY